VEIKGWHRRFLGNTKSAIWHADRKMGKDYIVLLDIVKYPRSIVVVPSDAINTFRARMALLYSSSKSLMTQIFLPEEFLTFDLSECSKHVDVMYFLEYGQYPKEVRDYILASAIDLVSENSLLKIRAKDDVTIHIVSSEYPNELKFLADALNVPLNRVVKDY